MLTVKPVMLEGNCVLLRPPSTTDVFGLSQAAKDGEIWNNPYAFFPHENDIFCIFRTLTTPSQHPPDETKMGRPKVHLILDVEHELVGKCFLRTSRLKCCIDADFMTDSGGFTINTILNSMAFIIVKTKDMVGTTC